MYVKPPHIASSKTLRGKREREQKIEEDGAASHLSQAA